MVNTILCVVIKCRWYNWYGQFLGGLWIINVFSINLDIGFLIYSSSYELSSKHIGICVLNKDIHIWIYLHIWV